MLYSFEFDEFDNPMHLSKVGNWVFTFLSPQNQLDHIQLAMTNVIPRSILPAGLFSNVNVGN